MDETRKKMLELAARAKEIQALARECEDSRGHQLGEVEGPIETSIGIRFYRRCEHCCRLLEFTTLSAALSAEGGLT